MAIDPQAFFDGQFHALADLTQAELPVTAVGQSQAGSQPVFGKPEIDSRADVKAQRKADLSALGGLARRDQQVFTAQLAAVVAQEVVQDSSVYEQLDLFGDIFERVRGQYVTPPDEKSLIENAINGMLSALDPHSSYMNPKTYKDMQVQTKGEFGGLGIEVTMENGVIKVVSPIDDTPAFKAGIGSGTTVVAVNGLAYDKDVLDEAVTAAKTGAPIELMLRDFDIYRTVKLDYRGGLRHPHLERIEAKPDYLTPILSARH